MLKVLRWEFNLWRAMYLWARGRLRGQAPGDEPIGYADATAPIMWALIVLNAIEIPALHIMIPWATVRFIVDLLGVYSLAWMVGILAIMKVHPHLATPAGLRVRYGASVDFTVPWEAIARVGSRIRSHQGMQTVRFEDSTLAVGVGSQTNIDIVLREPMALPVPKTGGQPVAELRVYADDPKALIASVACKRSTTGTSAPAKQPTP
ncbi:MAG TPA: hypothetical protein VFC19_21865 [Candidatus Limnocylindrales bacterium]|nr:hypothetical protein [Candidatus Limnocylindrales bacterium]